MNNDDFMLWLMKGYITQEKGYEINWAKVIALTTKKKCSEERNGSLEVLDLSARGKRSMQF